MCGIVGYAGNQPLAEVLLEGLRRVEYRGYDSAGIAWLDSTAKSIQVVRQTGKIAALAARLNGRVIQSNIGIGHTRWATHGGVTEANAHPHLSCRGDVAVVHNGTITNHEALKTDLVRRGHVFKSETDTEVLAHLIEGHIGRDPVQSLLSALRLVKGAYGIAVIMRRYPDRIFFARNGSPLCLGIGGDERFVASDAKSFRAHTHRQVVLEDGQVGYVTAQEQHVFDFRSAALTSQIEEIGWELEAIELGGHPTFMHKEIFGQPDNLTSALAGRLVSDGSVKLGGLLDREPTLHSAQNVILVAAGTSLHAGMIGEILLQEISGLPAHSKNASELANQEHPRFPSGTIVWAISQSGETKDVLLAIEKARQLRRPVFGLCNVPGSSIPRATDAGVFTNAGPEIGVASTKAFTAQVLALHLISLYLRQIRQVPPEPWLDKYVQELRRIPELVRQTLEIVQPAVRAVVDQYQHCPNFLFLGRGINHPTALEGALKLKEISYIHAEGYPCGEMKHGPLALVGPEFPTVVIAPLSDDHYPKIMSNIHEIRARRGRVIAIASQGDESIGQNADSVIYMPRVSYYLSPLLYVISLQLLAYEMAVRLGRDVDQPRHLAKSVTVE